MRSGTLQRSPVFFLVLVVFVGEDRDEDTDEESDFDPHTIGPPTSGEPRPPCPTA
jgi:hypothetical protein